MYGTELLPETTTVLLLVVVALVSLWWLSTRRPSGAPPGPGFALPVLGHMHLLRSDPRQKFAAWRRQYGDVFSLYLGRQLVVVLNGYDVIKDALVKHADVFSDRPHIPVLGDVKCKGIVESSGSVWKAQRKASLEILRELGMGKNILVEKIQEEVNEYVKAIAEKKSQPQDLARMTHVSVSNNICSIVFGKRFEYDDPVFIRYIGVIDANSRGIGAASLSQILPFLRFVPGDPFGINDLVRNTVATLETFVKPSIDRHAKEYDDNSVDDFISAYLRQLRRELHKATPSLLNEFDLQKTVMDLFAAGTETTAVIIRWTIAYFLHHPNVQDKCYEEIHRVVGTERAPTIHDRPELVYLEATIMEAMRYADIVPFSLPHSTAYEVEFRGFRIPKNTQIVPNLSSVLHAPEIWKDPDLFRPERFIGKDGRLARFEELIPFSIGRRLCLGEALARTQLFLYLSSMIQRFRFLPPETGQLPSLRGNLGLVDVPPPYMVRAVARE